MLSYEFQSLKKDSFPGNKHYLATYSAFEEVFKLQLEQREKFLRDLIYKVFGLVREHSGTPYNSEFQLTQGGGEDTVPAGHLFRYVVAVQQIFEMPLFEVTYAFSRWDLENRILKHYTKNPETPFNSAELFPANSVRVKIFPQGALQRLIETEFHSQEATFKQIAGGFAIQVVKS
jgi:hypothetical protein